MQKLSSWRELLEAIINTPAERERIAKAVGVRSITLTRWVNGESVPRAQNLRQLLRALPKEYQDEFRELLEREEGLSPLAATEEITPATEIPFTFINELFDTRASTPEVLRFWTLSRQILQHAIRHLDPESMGMVITVVRCMPPSADGKIHSLRECAGMGTPPWGSDLEHQTLFLGVESLAGYVVASNRSAVIHNLEAENTFIPAYQAEHEMSAVAFPLLYATRIAGCLLCSSTRPNYFESPSQLTLIHGYTNLMTLAFEPEEFYPPELIDLRVMPPPQVQQVHLASFRQRVQNIMQSSARTEHPLTMVQAQEMAWQQLEEILLHLPPQEH